MMQSAVTKFEIFSPVYLAGHGMEWRTIFPYFKLATFHSILIYQSTFRPEAAHNLYLYYVKHIFAKVSNH